jgi:hypothetical protein
MDIPSVFTDTEKLGVLLGAVKAYIDAPEQVKGPLYRELCATVAALDGKEYEGQNWPNLLQRRTEAVKSYLANTRDDLCHLLRNELAAAFGLEKPIDPSVLDPVTMMGNCVNYIKCLQEGKAYCNPETGRVHPHPNEQKHDDSGSSGQTGGDPAK